VRLDVPVAVIAVMMKSNYLRLADVARVAEKCDAPLRANVYQAVRSDIYVLSNEEYWEGFRRLFEETDVIAISFVQWRGSHRSEPVVGVSTRTSDTKSHDTTLRLLAKIR
jgi:hypothetical protein